MTTATFMSTYSNNTDSEFRTWVQGLRDAIIAVGLTLTADTGQVNTSTVLKPTAATTAKGYNIFRFNDALQATAPIYIKLEYGSGANATMPGIWFTAGKGTDGAGNLTGILHARAQTYYSGSYSSTPYLSYVSSGDGSMLCFSLWPGEGQLRSCFVLAFERSRASDGTITADGTYCYRFINGNNYTNPTSEVSSYSALTLNTLPRGCITIPYNLTSNISLNNAFGTPMFKGSVRNMSEVSWTPKCVLGYANLDAGSLQIVQVDNDHNYLALGPDISSSSDVAKQTWACLALAWW